MRNHDDIFVPAGVEASQAVQREENRARLRGQGVHPVVLPRRLAVAGQVQCDELDPGRGEERPDAEEARGVVEPPMDCDGFAGASGVAPAQGGDGGAARTRAQGDLLRLHVGWELQPPAVHTGRAHPGQAGHGRTVRAR